MRAIRFFVAKDYIRYAVSVVILIFTASTKVLASAESDIFVIVSEDANTHIFKQSIQSTASENIYELPSDLPDSRLVFIDSTNNKWDRSGNTLSFQSPKFNLMYRHEFGHQIQPVDDHSYDFKSREFFTPGGYSTFTFTWILPESMEVTTYSSNIHTANWLQSENILRFKTSAQNNIQLRINFRHKTTVNNEFTATDPEISREQKPINEDLLPSVEEQPAVTEQQALTSEQQSVTTEPQALNAEEQPAIAEPQALTTEEEPAITAPQALTTEEEPAITAPQALTTEEEPAITAPQALTMEEEPAITEPQALTAEEQPPMAEKQVPRNEESFEVDTQNPISNQVAMINDAESGDKADTSEINDCAENFTASVIKTLLCGETDALLLDPIEFESNSASLSPAVRQYLDTLVEPLISAAGVTFEIATYTDSKGPQAWNMTLSEERAQTIRLYLIFKGVKAAQLIAKGYGEKYPIASNATVDGRRTNRRVELVRLN